MKTLQLRLLVVFCFATMLCTGQKCKNFKKGVKRAKKHFVDKEIEGATKQRTLFSKFSQAVATYLVKSDESKYLAIVFVRELGRRIDLLDKDPIVLQFENGELLTLYAEKSSIGKFTLPVTTEINHQFYTITDEQLKQLASQPINHVKIYFTSDKVSDEKRSINDLGSFFDYEILNDRYKSNLIEAATCIYQL